MTDHAAEDYPTRLSLTAQQYRDEEEDQFAFARAHRLTKRPTRGPIQTRADSSSLICGLLAGVAQAGLFNPYDRALYLSVKGSRPFLALENWKAPYNGFFQSLGGRALAGGLYFPTEHFFLRCISPEESKPKYNLLAGTAAGAVNALLLNPLTAVKYKTWGRVENHGMLREAYGMMTKSGSLRPFFNGLAPTLWRDVVFGGCYTWLRLQLQWWFDLKSNEQWKANFVAAGLATVVSGPFNYVRNVQYATSSRDRAPSISQVLKELFYDVRQETHISQKLNLLQNRLRIGWGTARVAMGMAFAHSVYDALQRRLKPYPTR